MKKVRAILRWLAALAAIFTIVAGAAFTLAALRPDAQAFDAIAPGDEFIPDVR
jgi:hypothetical protein